MKMTAPQSMKFSKLKRRLKLPHWQIVGLLESIWLFTQVNAPAGDIGRHSNEDIAAGIEWFDDADLLISHLVESGWLEVCNVNRLLVHDWEDHAPNFLKGNMAKYGKSFAKKNSPIDGPRESPRDGAREVARDARMESPPNVGKPSQEKTKAKSPPTPPSGGASNENAKNAITDTKTGAGAPEAESHQDNAANAKPGVKELKLHDDQMEVYYAIAEITGRDSITSKGILLPVWRAVVEGGYTAAEVYEFGKRFRELLPGKSAARPTPGEVRNNIGLIRAVKLGENNGAKTKFRQQLDTVAGFLLNGVEHQPGNSVLSLSTGAGQ